MQVCPEVTISYIDNFEEQQYIPQQELKAISDVDLSMLLDHILEQSKIWTQPVRKEDLIIQNELEYNVVMHFRMLMKENNNNFVNNVIKNITVNKISNVYQHIQEFPKVVNIDTLQEVEQKIEKEIKKKPKLQKKKRFLF